jgi:uncharacterized RDD family membrane protein YckC
VPNLPRRARRPNPDAANPDAPDPYDPELTPLVSNFGRRFLARFVDTMLVFLIVTIVLSSYSETNAAGEQVIRAPTWVVALLASGVVLYEVLTTAWRGQTLGKFLAKVRVVAVDAPSGPASLTQAARRVLAPTAAGLLGIAAPAFLPFAVAAVYLSALMRRDGRGIPDRLAGTRVASLPR